MRALVVFESIFGNTHEVADRIAEGLGSAMTVSAVPADATAKALTGVDLVVVGAPTHMHGLPTEGSRARAEKSAVDGPGDLHLDPEGSEESVRDWLAGLAHFHCAAAAFDTKVDNRWSGQASRAIARRLRYHGFHLVADPISFLVDEHNRLVDGEEARARAWGEWLATQAAADGARSVTS
jgi:hypothetical protein